MAILGLLVVVDILFSAMFFKITTDNQKFILDKIHELKRKIDSKDNDLKIKYPF